MVRWRGVKLRNFWRGLGGRRKGIDGDTFTFPLDLGFNIYRCSEVEKTHNFLNNVKKLAVECKLDAEKDIGVSMIVNGAVIVNGRTDGGNKWVEKIKKSFMK